ncbi:DotA/TraY family protein [Phyllobacterium sp. 0TCS1.6C]|uniref:DotA/TraY family protein n=1 Tax=unclassified Phyllobacterium TaxID=2638441 RepID=UPI0022645947|nr:MULTISPECIES: DotA/TraY family protein [unclassified Phyllobacterium]MCX8281774.1 DotA/TraY family protein [Phyllobacterium sp. 0TCS1.6C]MCX8295309.1 DotA/TraY family protein [Phyllobacterium sp. 0TCS1.6A]
MEEQNVAQLFTPEDSSAALVFLRRLLGCTFDHVWMPNRQQANGSCDNTNDILALVVTTVNVAMLALIAVVATYLIFAALKDTANDGEVGGRSMNPSWTLIGAALAAILCFPAFNGFNALQVGTMQVAVWSTGLGDQTWRKAGEKMANANVVNSAFASKGDEGWFYSDPSTEKALREQIAAGLVARVAGEICRNAIAKGVASMASPSGSIETVSPNPSLTSLDDGYTQTMLTYRAGDGLDQSSGLCGAVTVSYALEKETPSSQNLTDGLAPENSKSQLEIIRASARFQADAAKAGADALLSSIKTEGDNLYKALFPPEGRRLRGKEQLTTIETAVTNTIDKSKNAMRTALTSAPEEIKKHTVAAMAGNQANGWFYAVLYQRVLVSATSSLGTLGVGGVEIITSKPVENLANVFQCGGWLGTSCANQLEVFFSQYKRDLLAFAEVEPAFRNAALNSSTHGVNSITVGNANSGGSALSKWLNDIMLSLADVETSGGEGYADPIPRLQATGSKIMAYGAGVLSASALSLAKNPVAVGLGELASLASPFGWALVAVGFVLAVVVPYMPLVYFFIAALSWLALAVQTIITAPFWLMQMFYPNRSGGISGTSFARVLMVLLGLLIRPALIIVGLIFCMVLMGVGIDYLNGIMANAFTALAYTGSSLTTGVGNMALALGGFVIYMSCAVLLVSVCCGFIDGVADFVMDMVESGASRIFGSEAKHRSDGVLGNPTSVVAAGIAIGRGGALAGTTARIATRARNASTAIAGTDKR